VSRVAPNRLPDLSAPENLVGIAVDARHQVELLQSQVKQSMDVVVSRLDSMGAEQRDLVKSMRAIAEQVSEFRVYSQGLERMARAIDSSTADRLRWQEEHERKHQAVAERVTRFSGALWGFGLAVGVILALSSYVVTEQFESIRASRAASEAFFTRETARLEARLEAVAKEARATRTLQ
jgi:hypothetical protein